jgi:hypothetical protein
MENGVMLHTFVRRRRLLVMFMLALLLMRVPLVDCFSLTCIMLLLRMPQTCRSQVIGVMDRKGVLCGRVGVAEIWDKVLIVGTQVGCGTVKISNSDPGGMVFGMSSK